jgi:hypothetical protein
LDQAWREGQSHMCTISSRMASFLLTTVHLSRRFPVGCPPAARAEPATLLKSYNMRPRSTVAVGLLTLACLFYAPISEAAGKCYASPPLPLGHCLLNECFTHSWTPAEGCCCHLETVSGNCSCYEAGSKCTIQGVCSYSITNCQVADGSGPCLWNEPPFLGGATLSCQRKRQASSGRRPGAKT